MELFLKLCLNLIKLGYVKSREIIYIVRIQSNGYYDFFKTLFVFTEVVLNGIELFHVQWASDLDKWYPLKKFSVKIVVSLRGRLINTAPKADSYLHLIQSHYLPRYDGIHAVCNNILFNAEIAFTQTNVRKRVVYSGINLGCFEFNASNKNSSNLLLTVGRCNWIKGLMYSIDAYSELLDLGVLNVSYEIVGIEPEGNYEEIIYRVNDKTLKNKIVLTPHLGEDELKMKMNSARILIVPSVMEGIANVAIEAMALGLLVVSSNVGGMSELIDSGKNGWLYDVRNSSDLAKLLVEIMSLNNEELNLIRINARNTIENKFNNSLMITNMLSLYEDVCT
jgi:colanic acid/amylovoran biosynthesis glycosyltransferase